MLGRVRVIANPATSRLVAEAVEGPLLRILEAIASDARRFVPVDTGALQSSIRVLGVRNGVGRVGAGDPGTPTEDYAAVVEGLAPKPTPRYPVQPYLRPALYRKRMF